MGMLRCIYAVGLGLLLLPGAVLAQQPSSEQRFVPFIVDAQKFQQIDEALSKLAMPRDAHAAWLQLWQGLEQQAAREDAMKHQSVADPDPKYQKKQVSTSSPYGQDPH